MVQIFTVFQFVDKSSNLLSHFLKKTRAKLSNSPRQMIIPVENQRKLKFICSDYPCCFCKKITQKKERQILTPSETAPQSSQAIMVERLFKVKIAKTSFACKNCIRKWDSLDNKVNVIYKFNECIKMA